MDSFKLKSDFDNLIENYHIQVRYAKAALNCAKFACEIKSDDKDFNKVRKEALQIIKESIDKFNFDIEALSPFVK